jgi:hypothetical protein
MKDIDELDVTVLAGMEIAVSPNSEPVYIGELYFAYIGYAPYDWLEIGLAAHSSFAYPYPSFDVKIDVIDIFTDSSRLSCLVVGGAGMIVDEDIGILAFHGGGALNFRLSQRWQLYFGAGTDSLFQALNLQAGAYLITDKQMGFSAGLNFVTGSAGMQLIPSFTVFVTFNQDFG